MAEPSPRPIANAGPWMPTSARLDLIDLSRDASRLRHTASSTPPAETKRNDAAV